MKYLSRIFFLLLFLSSHLPAASVIGVFSNDQKLKVQNADGSMGSLAVTVPKKMRKYLSSLQKAPYLKFHGKFATDDHFKAINIPTIYSGNYAYKGKLKKPRSFSGEWAPSKQSSSFKGEPQKGENEEDKPFNEK